MMLRLLAIHACVLTQPSTPQEPDAAGRIRAILDAHFSHAAPEHRLAWATELAFKVEALPASLRGRAMDRVQSWAAGSMVHIKGLDAAYESAAATEFHDVFGETAGETRAISIRRVLDYDLLQLDAVGKGAQSGQDAMDTKVMILFP